jgi:hypothetical protein
MAPLLDSLLAVLITTAVQKSPGGFVFRLFKRQLFFPAKERTAIIERFEGMSIVYEFSRRALFLGFVGWESSRFVIAWRESANLRRLLVYGTSLLTFSGLARVLVFGWQIWQGLPERTFAAPRASAEQRFVLISSSFNQQVGARKSASHARGLDGGVEQIEDPDGPLRLEDK